MKRIAVYCSLLALVIAAGTGGFAGCASRASLDGKACPCASGFICCDSTQTCVRTIASCPTGGDGGAQPMPDGGGGLGGLGGLGGIIDGGPGTPVPTDGAAPNYPGVDHWVPMSTAGAPALDGTVWTGQEMIVWGSSPNGARYNPATDLWTPTTSIRAPEPRSRHVVVWTGSEMLIWGGLGSSGPIANGGRYDPTTDSWQPVSTAGAPAASYGLQGLWTGSELLVWNPTVAGRYDPAHDSWRSMSTTGIPPASAGQQAVWTGSRVIVWGGFTSNNTPMGVESNAGAVYDPTADTWSPTSIAGAPSPRDGNALVWTGTSAMVWGGTVVLDPGGAGGAQGTNSGGLYLPDQDRWYVTSVENAPPEQMDYPGGLAVWAAGAGARGTGLVLASTGASASQNRAYDPVSDTWTAISTLGAIPFNGVMIWTGTELIVWNGSTAARYRP
jgi:hypothetical protein